MDAEGLDQQAVDSQLLYEEIVHNQKYGCYPFDMRAMRRATEYSEWSVDENGEPEFKWLPWINPATAETTGYHCNRCGQRWVTWDEASDHATRSVELAAARRRDEGRQ